MNEVFIPTSLLPRDSRAAEHLRPQRLPPSRTRPFGRAELPHHWNKDHVLNQFRSPGQVPRFFLGRISPRPERPHLGPYPTAWCVLGGHTKRYLRIGLTRRMLQGFSPPGEHPGPDRPTPPVIQRSGPPLSIRTSAARQTPATLWGCSHPLGVHGHEPTREGEQF
jgi:hypothetical protein